MFSKKLAVLLAMTTVAIPSSKTMAAQISNGDIVMTNPQKSDFGGPAYHAATYPVIMHTMTGACSSHQSTDETKRTLLDK